VVGRLIDRCVSWKHRRERHSTPLPGSISLHVIIYLLNFFFQVDVALQFSVCLHLTLNWHRFSKMLASDHDASTHSITRNASAISLLLYKAAGYNRSTRHRVNLAGLTVFFVYVYFIAYFKAEFYSYVLFCIYLWIILHLPFYSLKYCLLSAMQIYTFFIHLLFILTLVYFYAFWSYIIYSSILLSYAQCIMYTVYAFQIHPKTWLFNNLIIIVNNLCGKLPLDRTEEKLFACYVGN